MIRTTPQQWNATVYAGQTFDWTWEVKDAAGDPLDLTGVDVRAQARTQLTASTAVLTFGTADGSIITGGTAGTIRFLQSATVTAALGAALSNEPAGLVFDAEAVELTGDVSRILEGYWTVMPEVTR